MITKKIQVACYLSFAQAKALKKLSDKTRVPQAVWLREGVDFILKKYQGARHGH